MSKFSTIALIVAAGSGSRFGVELPKQYALLGGKPLLRHSLETLLKHPKIDAVAAVISPEHADFYENATSGLTLLPPIHGGKERQDSVRLGLQALAKYKPTRVLVHDAARPGLSTTLLDRLLANNAVAVIPALPMVDTVRRRVTPPLTPPSRGGGKFAAPSPLEGEGRGEGCSFETLDRSSLYRVQTPQYFDYAKLVELHEQARVTVTDDAGLFEAAGLEVATVLGDPHNEKITTLEDWKRMQKLHEAYLEVRVGSGYDVHAFEKAGSKKEVIICGTKIPHSAGLEGHSDADVGLHALVDALLGAASEGDIGVHFPPSDAKWKGADSAQFVTYTRDLIRSKGGILQHIDITIICEKPKITPHREQMRERIAELLELDIARVSVKATTTEKLGFTGREEGIAAQAIATIKL